MEDYYAMIFEPINIDVGHVVFRPLRLAKGYYDENDNSFIADEMFYEEISNYPMPGITIGEDSAPKVEYTNLTNEDRELDDLHVFAFPISESELRQIFDGKLDLKAYEEDIRSYGFSLVYRKDYQSVILVATDLVKQKVYLELDGSLDFDTSIINAYSPEPVVEKRKPKVFFDPDELERQMKADVRGQDEIIEAIVNTIYLNVEYGVKSNLLLLGPSGNGKTEIIRSLAKHLDRPLFIEDVTKLSATGYYGKSPSQIMKSLITVAGGDVKKAEFGIVALDEIDKIMSLDEREAVSKGDVQDELLKMLEGDPVEFEVGQFGKTMTIDTKNIIFIGTGAATKLFESLLASDKSIGFNAVVDVSKKSIKDVKVTIADLEKAGFKLELLGRLEDFMVINKLTIEDYIDIMENGTNSVLRELVRSVKERNHVDILYDREYLEEVANLSDEQGTGARGLKSIILKSLKPGIRYIRKLQGEGGTLIINKGTVHNPNSFELVNSEGEKVYSKLLK